MPLQEYKCENPECGYQFEKLVQKANDDPEECPRCKTLSKKVLSVPGQFQWGKGGGWNR